MISMFMGDQYYVGFRERVVVGIFRNRVYLDVMSVECQLQTTVFDERNYKFSSILGSELVSLESFAGNEEGG